MNLSGDTGLIKDVSLSLWKGDRGRWPVIERFVLIAALMAGMLVAALRTRSFKLALSSWRVFSRHLFAGILMAIGFVIAGGKW